MTDQEKIKKLLDLKEQYMRAIKEIDKQLRELVKP